jgi:hypothetical protein
VTSVHCAIASKRQRRAGTGRGLIRWGV